MVYNVLKDLNLRDADDEKLRNVAAAAAYWTNVVIPGQDLDKAEYARILRGLGRNPKRDVWFEDKENPEIIYVTNKVLPGETERQGLFARGELEWHQNGTLAVDPEDVVTLYCEQPADSGCNTIFSNGVTAYENLPLDVKDKIKDSFLILSSGARPFQKLDLEYFGRTQTKPRSLWGKGGPYKFEEGQVEADEQAELFKFLHTGYRSEDSPVRKDMLHWRDQNTDPEGKWKCVFKPILHEHRVSHKVGLYFPFATVCGFTGVPEDEWQDLHTFLVDHYLQYTYSHEWKQGDVVLFDNTQGLHKRDPIPMKEDGTPEERELWRGAFWYNDIS